MADKVHDCDIPEAWEILRSHLQKELVGDLIPVPFVTEGDLYDLMTVFYKQDDGKVRSLKLKDENVPHISSDIRPVCSVRLLTRL